VDARGVLKGDWSRELVSSATTPAKAEIRYSEIVGAASVSVTIPIFSRMILTKTSFVVVFGDILRGHPLESDNLRAFAGRDMHLLSSKNLQKPVVSIISVRSWTWGRFL
jgi:hypothetical protein